MPGKPQDRERPDASESRREDERDTVEVPLGKDLNPEKSFLNFQSNLEWVIFL